MPTCLNLAELFGDRYRIGHDEVAQTWGERADPWMMTILCRRGVIYPQGGDLLAVEVDYRPGIAKQLAALGGVRCVQDGDHEKTFVFPVALFDAVAAIVKPRKRRKLSPERRARLVAMGSKYLLQGKTPRAQSEISSAGEIIGPSRDPEAA